MRVILKSDVKNVGKVGDVVRVSAGYARNFLFPRNLAQEATEKREKELKHLQKMAEAKMKKAVSERQGILDKLAGVTVAIKAKAGETDKLFGAVTNANIADSLETLGFSVDKRDIHLDEPIKDLGQHKALVKLGDGMETDLKVLVERI